MEGRTACSCEYINTLHKYHTYKYDDGAYQIPLGSDPKKVGVGRMSRRLFGDRRICSTPEYIKCIVRYWHTRGWLSSKIQLRNRPKAGGFEHRPSRRVRYERSNRHVSPMLKTIFCITHYRQEQNPDSCCQERFSFRLSRRGPLKRRYVKALVTGALTFWSAKQVEFVNRYILPRLSKKGIMRDQWLNDSCKRQATHESPLSPPQSHRGGPEPIFLLLHG